MCCQFEEHWHFNLNHYCKLKPKDKKIFEDANNVTMKLDAVTWCIQLLKQAEMQRVESTVSICCHGAMFFAAGISLRLGKELLLQKCQDVV